MTDGGDTVTVQNLTPLDGGLAEPAIAAECQSSVAFLGDYLEHRHQTPRGIQVLWRGWLKLHDLCLG